MIFVMLLFFTILLAVTVCVLDFYQGYLADLLKENDVGDVVLEIELDDWCSNFVLSGSRLFFGNSIFQ